MKILFVSDTYYPHINGVYYFVCRVAPLLQDKGHQIKVIAPSDTSSAFIRTIDNLEVYGLPSLPVFLYTYIRIPVLLGMKRRIRKIINDFKPDIIHIQDHFLISKAVVELNREFKLPIIATNHFMPENITVLVKSEFLKQKLEKFLWKGFSKVYNQADLVTTPTITGVNIIRPHIRPEIKTIALSSGVDLQRFHPSKEMESIKKKYGIPDKPALLYVGRLDPEKRIEEIFEAIKLAGEKMDLCFIIVGKGTQSEELKTLAVTMGIAEKVIFTGFVPDEELPAFYNIGRCFIIASIAELLSLVTLQAMASGMPVIAANAAALTELVDGNGYLYEVGNIPALILSIENIISDETLYQQMRNRSLELIQKHDIKYVVNAFEQLYEASIQNKKMAHSSNLV
jgi:glycosyltransferase involved in cell wall biosynthesis